MIIKSGTWVFHHTSEKKYYYDEKLLQKGTCSCPNYFFFK